MLFRSLSDSLACGLVKEDLKRAESQDYVAVPDERESRNVLARYSIASLVASPGSVKSSLSLNPALKSQGWTDSDSGAGEPGKIEWRLMVNLSLPLLSFLTLAV